MGSRLSISVPARHGDCNVGAAIAAASGKILISQLATQFTMQIKSRANI